eukprot:6160888-Amphidinium_carterae.1
MSEFSQTIKSVIKCVIRVRTMRNQREVRSLSMSPIRLLRVIRVSIMRNQSKVKSLSMSPNEIKSRNK